MEALIKDKDFRFLACFSQRREGERREIQFHAETAAERLGSGKGFTLRRKEMRKGIHFQAVIAAERWLVFLCLVPCPLYLSQYNFDLRTSALDFGFWTLDFPLL